MRQAKIFDQKVPRELLHRIQLMLMERVYMNSTVWVKDYEQHEHPTIFVQGNKDARIYAAGLIDGFLWRNNEIDEEKD